MSILNDGIRLARLKRSVGRDHAHPRPLPPIQVAKYLQEMKEALDDSSNTKTAERVGIKEVMINDFLSLLKLPSKYNDVWGFSSDSDGKIPFSMFRRAGKFYEQKIISEEEFGMLVNGVLNDQINTSSIEDILYLIKRNPTKSFENCCKEILNLIPERIKSIVFITDLDTIVVEKIRDHARINSKSDEDVIELVLSKYLDDKNIEGVLLKNDKHLKIALNQEGRKKLDEIANKEKKLIIEIVNHLFLKEGFGPE